MIRSALRRLVDLLVFALWDRYHDLRPVAVRIVYRFTLRWPDDFVGHYYRHLFINAGISSRGLRYLEARQPRVIFLWRMAVAARALELAKGASA